MKQRRSGMALKNAMARPGFVWDGSGVAAGSALALASMPVFVVFDPPSLVDGRKARFSMHGGTR